MPAPSKPRRGVRIVCVRCGADLPRLGAPCPDCERAATTLERRTRSRLLDVAMTAGALMAAGVPVRAAVVEAARIERGEAS